MSGQTFEAARHGIGAAIVILFEQQATMGLASCRAILNEPEGGAVLLARKDDRPCYGHGWQLYGSLSACIRSPLAARRSKNCRSKGLDAAVIGLICDLHPSYAFIRVPGEDSRSLLYFHRRADYQGLTSWDRLLCGDRVEFVEELPTPRHGRRARQVKSLARSVWDASMKERTP